MLFYNCSVFTYSTVAGRKCEINVIVIVITITLVKITSLYGCIIYFCIKQSTP